MIYFVSPSPQILIAQQAAMKSRCLLDAISLQSSPPQFLILENDIGVISLLFLNLQSHSNYVLPFADFSCQLRQCCGASREHSKFDLKEIRSLQVWNRWIFGLEEMGFLFFLFRAFVGRAGLNLCVLLWKLGCWFNCKDAGLGYAVTPHSCNEMMRLYVSIGQFEKVPLIIQHMKHNGIPRNVLSYNLWMSACGELSWVVSAEMVYKEMVNDKSVEVCWSTYCTLSNMYIKSGFVEKATVALKTAEQKISKHKYIGLFFLITMHANLSNTKNEILRHWEAISKAVSGRIILQITCAYCHV